MKVGGLHSILSISEIAAATAVRIGNLWIPPSQLERVLSKYSHALIGLNPEVDNYPYSLLGSSTALKFGERHLMFFCQHQIKQFSPENVAIMPRHDFGALLITGQKYQFAIKNKSYQDEEIEDLCFYEFLPEKYDIPNLENEFFKITDEDCWPRNTLNRLIGFGYPIHGDGKTYLLDEEETKLIRLHLREVVLPSEPVPNFKSSARGLQHANVIGKRFRQLYTSQTKSNLNYAFQQKARSLGGLFCL